MRRLFWWAFGSAVVGTLLLLLEVCLLFPPLAESAASAAANAQALADSKEGDTTSGSAATSRTSHSTTSTASITEESKISTSSSTTAGTTSITSASATTSSTSSRPVQVQLMEGPKKQSTPADASTETDMKKLKMTEHDINLDNSETATSGIHTGTGSNKEQSFLGPPSDYGISQNNNNQQENSGSTTTFSTAAVQEHYEAQGMCSVRSWLDPLIHPQPQPQSDSQLLESNQQKENGQQSTSTSTSTTTTSTMADDFHATTKRANTHHDNLPPVFMIPSFAGTRLRTWNSVDCGIPFANFHVGGSVWLDTRRLLAQTTCWIKCLKLVPETQQDELCVTRPDEGLDAITQVDEQLPTGFLWKAAIHMLAEELGYQPGTSMLAHPYDWRLPPILLQQRDRSFSRLKGNIERVVHEYQERNPQSPIRGVYLVAFSMGNLFTQYFFQYLQAELGPKGMERWVDRHIFALFMAGAPFLGSQSSIDSIIGGETAGLPIQKEQCRDMMLTWGSMPWMMPNNVPPRIQNDRHKAMNHGEADFPVSAVELTTRNGTLLRPSNADLVRAGGWFGKTGDPRLAGVQQIIDRWYGNDPLFGKNDGVVTREPFVPPKNIDHVICAYGVNVPTPVQQIFEEDRSNPGIFKKVDELINNRGDVRSSRTGQHVLPARQRYATRKSGDGTVDYVSLSWCHSWFGEQVVNVTKIPANRKYEQDEIEHFENIDVLDPKQLSLLQRHPHGFHTFYSQRWMDVHPESGLQRPRSMQIWEFDGISHRDSVTHRLFLRIWKDILNGTTAFSEAYMAARERVLEKAWNAIDESGTLESISNDWMMDVAKEGTFQGSSGTIPTSDQDCFWNYAEVRCDRPRFCEYQYKVGDVHLSQSCRLRKTPLSKDDPQLLLRDAVAHNVSYAVGTEEVLWQTVYRNQEPSLLQPWAQLFLAFVGGALALALLLFGIICWYGAERFFPRKGAQ